MAHKLITKSLQHTKKYIFCQSEKKFAIILIHSHQVAILVLAVVIFFIWQPKEIEVSAPD